jgi:hypothetical protein
MTIFAAPTAAGFAAPMVGEFVGFFFGFSLGSGNFYGDKMSLILG